MSQRDGFAGGFFTGILLGGVIGGVVGAIAASARNRNDDVEEVFLPSNSDAQLSAEEGIENARQSLEAKIAQLNLAIDDVRQQLGSVNGNAMEKELD